MRAPRLLAVLAAAGLGFAFFAAARAGGGRRSYGWPTSASAAVDPPQIDPDATPDEVLDAAVQYTFPASDPIAVETAYRLAERRQSAARQAGL